MPALPGLSDESVKGPVSRSVPNFDNSSRPPRGGQRTSRAVCPAKLVRRASVVGRARLNRNSWANPALSQDVMDAPTGGRTLMHLNADKDFSRDHPHRGGR